MEYNIDFKKISEILKKEEERKLKEGDIINFEGVNMRISRIDKNGIISAIKHN